MLWSAIVCGSAAAGSGLGALTSGQFLSGKSSLLCSALQGAQIDWSTPFDESFRWILANLSVRERESAGGFAALVNEAVSLVRGASLLHDFHVFVEPYSDTYSGPKAV